MSIQCVNLVVALTCEAKPLIDFYKLTKHISRPFALYQGYLKPNANLNETAQINLIISGSGVVKMSAAVAWLGAYQQQQTLTNPQFETANNPAAWINVGTAGHESIDVDEIRRIHQITGLGLHQTHYPPLVSKCAADSCALITVNEVCQNYPKDAAVDMEASSFFATAQQFAPAELVQSIKVISDNASQATSELNANKVTDLIAHHTDLIDNFVQAQWALPVASSTALTKQQQSAVAHLHCTLSQRLQYKDLIERLTVLNALDADIEFTELKSMSDVLKSLRNQLSVVSPTLVN